MGIADKADNASEQTQGKAKELFGDATDNARLESEGLEQQTRAEAEKETADAKREAEELLAPDPHQDRIR